jgi:hypothetical protein
VFELKAKGEEKSEDAFGKRLTICSIWPLCSCVTPRSPGLVS